MTFASELCGKVEVDTGLSGTQQLPEESTSSTQDPETRKRRVCYVQKCKNKTYKVCDTCKKPLCGSCNVSKILKCEKCV